MFSSVKPEVNETMGRDEDRESRQDQVTEISRSYLENDTIMICNPNAMSY